MGSLDGFQLRELKYAKIKSEWENAHHFYLTSTQTKGTSMWALLYHCQMPKNWHDFAIEETHTQKLCAYSFQPSQDFPAPFQQTGVTYISNITRETCHSHIAICPSCPCTAPPSCWSNPRQETPVWRYSRYSQGKWSRDAWRVEWVFCMFRIVHLRKAIPLICYNLPYYH